MIAFTSLCNDNVCLGLSIIIVNSIIRHHRVRDLVRKKQTYNYANGCTDYANAMLRITFFFMSLFFLIKLSVISLSKFNNFS